MMAPTKISKLTDVSRPWTDSARKKGTETKRNTTMTSDFKGSADTTASIITKDYYSPESKGEKLSDWKKENGNSAKEHT